MKRLIIGAVLAICSPFVHATMCIDEDSAKHNIEPYEDNTLLINDNVFDVIRSVDFSDENTTLLETWLQDSSGAIAMIAVITNKNSNAVTTKLYMIEGSVMTVGTCK